MSSVDDAPPARPSTRTISRLGVLIVVAGVLLQFVLAIYYLAMAHAPRPHDLPVGVVGTQAQRDQIAQRLERDDEFRVDGYDDAASLRTAISERRAYGGVVFEGQVPTLYVASAAAPAVANLLRSGFDQAYQQQLQEQVKQATASGRAVAPDQVAALTTPPAVDDVVPLPDDDRLGSSLGFLIQALCLGGSVASLALGRLGRLTVASPRRGLAHAGLLVVYALGSSAVGVAALEIVGVAPGNTVALFGGFALISLAVTASTAAAVALIGPAGSLVGAMYFTLGLIISGSSIAPEMLPTAGRVVGQALPPGAGATLVRDALYFPDASTRGPFLVLIAFAAAGLLVVLVSNARANPTSHTSVARGAARHRAG